MRYSRGVLKERYITSSTVFLAEILKIIFSMSMIAAQTPNPVSQYQELILNSLEMSIPACVFFVQNLLAFVALQYLDPALFSVLSQLKILTTAVFSVIMLGNRINATKWRALFLVFLGIVLVQYVPPTCEGTQQTVSDVRWTGILAVIGMATCSGLSGVYTEKVLKKSENFSIWDRNFQLGFYSLVFSLIGVLTEDYETLTTKGFFYGYSFYTIGVIFITSLGGILVAVVVKSTNNITKGFVSSLSIISTSLVGHFWFEHPLTPVFCVGSAVVIISIFNYHDPSSEPPEKIAVV